MLCLSPVKENFYSNNIITIPVCTQFPPTPNFLHSSKF